MKNPAARVFKVGVQGPVTGTTVYKPPATA